MFLCITFLLNLRPAETKLILSTALRHVRRVEVHLHSFLTSTPGGDKWSVRTQAELLGRKIFLHLLCRRMGGSWSFSDHCGQEGIFCSCRESKHNSSTVITRSLIHYSDRATSAPLWSSKLWMLSLMWPICREKYRQWLHVLTQCSK